MAAGEGNEGIRGRRHPLRRFVHRTLLLRLAAAALAMAAVTSVTVALLERNRVSGDAVAHALARADRFHALHGELYADPARVDAAALREALLAFRGNLEKSSLGDFVAFRLWRPDGTPLTEIHLEGDGPAPEVRAAVAGWTAPRTEDGKARGEPMRIGGKPYLRIVLPVRGPAGDTLGVADALFAFSPETIRAFRRDGLRAGLWIALAVLLTAAIIYPVVLHLTGRVVDFSVRLLDANMDTLETLGNAIAQRDSDTDAHNYRVTLLSARIGEEMGLPAAEMRTLIKGAFLHDVGKIGIPDRVLLKPGRLDDSEFELMKTHVEHGREILGRSSWLQDALNVVMYHHETVAGRGYPRGVAGEEIPLTARIFAVADVFDALTSKRPYKNPFPFGQAMEILEEGRGTHFDPQVLDVFARIAGPLYGRLEENDAVPRKELAGIMRTWFREEMDSLEY